MPLRNIGIFSILRQLFLLFPYLKLKHTMNFRFTIYDYVLALYPVGFLFPSRDSVIEIVCTFSIADRLIMVT